MLVQGQKAEKGGGLIFTNVALHNIGPELTNSSLQAGQDDGVAAHQADGPLHPGHGPARRGARPAAAAVHAAEATPDRCTEKTQQTSPTSKVGNAPRSGGGDGSAAAAAHREHRAGGRLRG